MYIPYPRGIEYSSACIAATVLTGVLLWEGNAPYLCCLIFLQILVATLGFNLAGGLRSPAGSYIFFVTILCSLLGIVVKAGLNEPLIETVPNIVKTMEVYLAGTCAITVAIKASQYFKPSKPFLQGGLTKENTPRVVAGCFLLAAGIPLAIQVFSPAAGSGANESGSLASFARQLNLAAPLGIIIAVYQRVKQTGGKSSFSWLAAFIWAYITIMGIFGYSKEGMFYPTFAWILAGAAARLRVTFAQILTVGSFVAVAVFILVPFSQYGRNFRKERPEKAIELLSHPLQTRAIAVTVEEKEEAADNFRFYRKSQGLLDRLVMIPFDSAIISRTDTVGTIGMRNVFIWMENIVPHFLAPNKPSLLSGNEYAHELGILADDDNTTGISFSPFAESYHMGGWLGTVLLLPALLFVMFVILQWAVGTVDETPWALFYIVLFGHAAPEGGIGIAVGIPTITTISLVVTALTMIYLAPLLGTLIIGPGKRNTVAT